jgi:hypothetical protein
MATKKIDINRGAKSLKIKKETALIISVDGTLADTTKQQHEDMITSTHSVSIIAEKAVFRVKVNFDIAKRIRSYIENRQPVFFLTNRPEGLRLSTTEWLGLNGLWNATCCYILCRENYINRSPVNNQKASITYVREMIGLAYEKNPELIAYYEALKIHLAPIGGV